MVFNVVAEEYESPTTEQETENVIVALERNGVKFDYSSKPKKGTTTKPPRITMRIDIPATTPTRTIAAVTSMLQEDLAKNNKRGGGECINSSKIQAAEKMIRGALVELYRGLGLLKTYRFYLFIYFYILINKQWISNIIILLLIIGQDCDGSFDGFGSSLNMVAFTKILKKFDKVWYYYQNIY